MKTALKQLDVQTAWIGNVYELKSQTKTLKFSSTETAGIPKKKRGSLFSKFCHCAWRHDKTRQ